MKPERRNFTDWTDSREGCFRVIRYSHSVIRNGKRKTFTHYWECQCCCSPKTFLREHSGLRNSKVNCGCTSTCHPYDWKLYQPAMKRLRAERYIPALIPLFKTKST